jgi:hypothetical protein
MRRRLPAPALLRIGAALCAIALSAALFSCASPPRISPIASDSGGLGRAESAPGAVALRIAGDVATEPLGPWRVERFSVVLAGDVAHPVEVTVVIISSPPAVVTVRPGSDARSTTIRIGAATTSVSAGITLGVTPWQYGPRRPFQRRERSPVGIVQVGPRRFSEAAEPYWALVLAGGGEWGMAPQGTLSTRSQTEGPPMLALGAFYPLIAEGRPVADRYPGRGIRAARVAVGGTSGRSSGGAGSHGGGGLVVAATTGSRPGLGVGRKGLTTGELAALLEGYDLEWALNLDGGRSALLTAASPGAIPWRRPPRRPGPVRLRLEG